MKIAFIGGGNMGQAMLSSIPSSSLFKLGDITVADKDSARLAQLEKDYKVKTTQNNIQAIRGADVVVLAIKPQNLDEVMSDIGGRLKNDQLVLSIVAGKSLDTLKNGLKHESIVRAMPNTPAQIAQGMTVWTATSSVSEHQKAIVCAILGSMGKEVNVNDDRYIDIATAVSGSGPAYVFLFMESLINAAIEIGLSPEDAGELVSQTVIGAALYAVHSDKDLSALREMVTSPGGTTAEALKVFEQGDFPELVKKAVAAAYRRAKELGG